MTSIPSLMDFDRSKVRVSPPTDGQIKIYYEKTPLHVKTSCWSCPFGKSDTGQIVGIIPDDQYFQVEALDKLGQDVCRHYHLKILGSEPPVDNDDLPYKSLIHHDDDLDTLHMQFSDKTRIFDNNNIRLVEDSVHQFTSGQFSSNFLLSFAALKIYNGHFFWSPFPAQMKIRKFCALPEGCIIFNEEEPLKEELKKRKNVTIKVRVPDDEAVTDFDPDVNELLA
jgi:hypothetical protein